MSDEFSRETPSRAQLTTTASALIIAAIIVATLYFGRDVLVPVALAVLLSFVLAPLVRLLQKVRVPRIPAISIVVLVTFATLSILAAVMASQVTQLAGELPGYQETIRAKINSVRGGASNVGSTALERAADVLRDLRRELERPAQNPFDRRPTAERQSEATPDKPIPVEVRLPDPGPLTTFGSFIAPLVQPLTTTGLVIIFVIFILAQREDLRNRIVRLAGAHDLQNTTAALDDAALRLSRLFLAQLALNAGFGLVIGLGLFLIGVPSAALWGILAGVLRFVPYIGAFIAAAFPLALSVAVDPGWTMLLMTVALFIIIEPIVGHVIEPLLYGRSTGLSPVAIVAAATFWTWLWGPVGLVLATPLTVCLVVLGRHVERLTFLDIMLGDRPPLTGPELFYQRALAGDPPEVAENAADFLKEHSLVCYLDDVALAGLRLAHNDFKSGKLDATRQARISGTVAEVMEDVSSMEEKAQSDKHDVDPLTDNEAGAKALLPVLASEDRKEDWKGEAAIICVGARTPMDQATATLLSGALNRHVGPARLLDRSALSSRVIEFAESRDVRLVCISYLDVRGLAQVRYDVRRIRSRMPRAMIMLACWDSPERFMEIKDQSGADLVVTSIREAVMEVQTLAIGVSTVDLGANIQSSMA